MCARRFRRIAILVFAVSVVGVIAGCQNTALKERNLALQGQLTRQAIEIGHLQRELDEMSAQPAPHEEVSAKEPEKPAEAKKPADFGEGIEVIEDKGVVTVVLPNTILFASGQAVLKPGSKAVLKRIAQVVKANYPTEDIRVEGHTDSDPIRKSKKKWKTNWELSCARALAVVHYLVGQGGLDPKRVYAAGFAEHRSVASNATAAGKAKNRRVQIVIVPK